MKLKKELHFLSRNSPIHFIFDNLRLKLFNELTEKYIFFFKDLYINSKMFFLF